MVARGHHAKVTVMAVLRDGVVRGLEGSPALQKDPLGRAGH